jgi:hypothetical protein
MHGPKTPRLLLADALDFVCFVAIVLLLVAGAILTGMHARAHFMDLVWILVAIVPLGLWVAAMVALRRYLEVSEPRRPLHQQLHEMGFISRDIDAPVL